MRYRAPNLISKKTLCLSPVRMGHSHCHPAQYCLGLLLQYMHCILYIIHYILYIVYYTLYIIHYILYIIYYILYIIHYILYIVYGPLSLPSCSALFSSSTSTAIFTTALFNGYFLRTKTIN